MSVDPQAIAAKWLSTWITALDSLHSPACAELFLADGWMRDFLVFSWDIRSLVGRDKITTYLANNLARTAIADVKLDQSVNLSPRVLPIFLMKGAESVELAFTFETKVGHGRAHARLVQDTDGEFRALTLFTELVNLRGYEELPTLQFRDDVTGIPGRDMQREFEEYVKGVEEKPYVLIVGGGQTGLLIAARFKQMNIPSVVIERTSRIGDAWRKRYPTLTLHTVKRHHTMLYQPYPDNWPEFTPRDKLADWLEGYPRIQDLVVWTKTDFKDRPVYNKDTESWDVTLSRDGKEVKLHPAHIVLATGSLGEPMIPNVPERERFKGHVLHSHVYGGGAPYAGKHVVVIGAGNSSIDICQDLHLKGAASVTMVQRSATCVTARETVAAIQRAEYPPGVPLDICDFKWASWPFGLQKRLGIENQQFFWDSEKELHDKLRKGGLKLTMGPEGEGLYLLVIGRGGGFCPMSDQRQLAKTYAAGLDKGGADLIADGRIKIRQGVSPQKFNENGLVMSDGSELLADVVIFATGYQSMRESNAALLGEDVVKRTDEVYGLDEEGEIKGSYRPSGYPGLWFASGAFSISRTMSRPLAIQLRAIQLGMLKHNGQRGGAVDGSVV